MTTLFPIGNLYLTINPVNVTQKLIEYNNYNLAQLRQSVILI